MKRQIRIEGPLAYVPLTQGYEAVIDSADVPLVDGRNWYAMIDGPGRVYAATKVPLGPGKRKQVRMHVLLLGLPDAVKVDHQDGDGLNNRRTNLRGATDAENARNCGIRKDNSTGVKGVWWSKQDGRWRAAIRVEGKRHFLGSFTDLDLAACAYAEASARLHGNFGRVARRGASL